MMKYTPKLPIQAIRGMNKAALNRRRNRPSNADDVITELCPIIVSDDETEAVIKVHSDMEQYFTAHERSQLKDVSDIPEKELIE